jgi:hypothetical protein
LKLFRILSPSYYGMPLLIICTLAALVVRAYLCPSPKSQPLTKGNPTLV